MENKEFYDVQETGIVNWEDPFKSQATQFFTSLKSESLQNKATILKALNAVNKRFEDLDNGIFLVENVLIHPVQVMSKETGEIVNTVRTVLISPTEETVAFTSQGILNSLKNLFALFGSPPWQGGLKIKVRQIGTRGGYRTYNLEVIV